MDSKPRHVPRRPFSGDRLVFYPRSSLHNDHYGNGSLHDTTKLRAKGPFQFSLGQASETSAALGISPKRKCPEGATQIVEVSRARSTSPQFCCYRDLADSSRLSSDVQIKRTRQSRCEDASQRTRLPSPP